MTSVSVGAQSVVLETFPACAASTSREAVPSSESLGRDTALNVRGLITRSYFSVCFKTVKEDVYYLNVPMQTLSAVYTLTHASPVFRHTGKKASWSLALTLMGLAAHAPV